MKPPAASLSASPFVSQWTTTAVLRSFRREQRRSCPDDVGTHHLSRTQLRSRVALEIATDRGIPLPTFVGCSTATRGYSMGLRRTCVYHLSRSTITVSTRFRSSLPGPRLTLDSAIELVHGARGAHEHAARDLARANRGTTLAFVPRRIGPRRKPRRPTPTHTREVAHSSPDPISDRGSA